jgi:hypothetical protein
VEQSCRSVQGDASLEEDAGIGAGVGLELTTLLIVEPTLSARSVLSLLRIPLVHGQMLRPGDQALSLRPVVNSHCAHR